MVQEEYKASSINNAYYGSGTNCSPSLAGNTSINTDLFGGKAQLDISDPKFYFCIASGADSDGGFKIFTERTDGTDAMTLNANNKKESVKKLIKVLTTTLAEIIFCKELYR